MSGGSGSAACRGLTSTKSAAELRGAPGGQVTQIVEVSDPPGSGGSELVELGHQPPRATPRRSARRVEPVRCDHQDGRRRTAAAARVQVVPAGREVGGQRPGRPAHEHAIDLSRLDPAVDSHDVAPFGPVLELHPHGHLIAVRHVHQDLARRARPRHDGRWEDPGPRSVLVCRQGLSRGCRRGRIDPEGAQDCTDGGGRDVDRAALPVPVLECHRVRDRQGAQHLVRGVVRPGVRAHQQLGRRCAQGEACSSWAPSDSSVASSPGRPTSCTPTGRPSSVQCSGSESAG